MQSLWGCLWRIKEIFVAVNMDKVLKPMHLALVGLSVWEVEWEWREERKERDRDREMDW